MHVTLRMLGIWALRGVPDDGAAANAIIECAKLGGWSVLGPLDPNHLLVAAIAARATGCAPPPPFDNEICFLGMTWPP